MGQWWHDVIHADKDSSRRQWFSNFNKHQRPSEGLLKQIAGHHHQKFWFSESESFLTRFQEMLMLLVKDHTLDTPVLRVGGALRGSLGFSITWCNRSAFYLHCKRRISYSFFEPPWFGVSLLYQLYILELIHVTEFQFNQGRQCNAVNGFESQLCYFPAMWSWASCLT